MTETSTNEIVTALRASLKDVERLKQQNSALSEERHEPIAIVGMGCSYPGGACSPEELWKLVVRGDDAISAFPDDRGWDIENLYDPDPDRPGTSYTREGGFLHDAAGFDAAFFGIAPREALAMDPQQRLLLETCWKALEDAGFDPFSLKGSQTGVFAGISSQDYLHSTDHLSNGVEGYGITGSSTSVVSGRVAYTFGFEGPAVTVDTACSSSLVALHMACQALRAGDCSLALAGGVTVLATPGVFTEFSRQRGLSPDGRCRSFSDSANGTGLSEGVGVVLLERLSDARRFGHQILAVVRGCAVNQDGASNGLTAPNGPSQQRVIRQALANARVSAAEVDVVEAHGTGTTLGDPIEAQALLATYGRDRPDGRPLWLGSIKSNIGHTQAAAGMAGVIKMVSALRHELLPKTLHMDVPSRQVDWSDGSVSLLTETVPWTQNEKPRRAAVSSFGISGTNAHVILEEAPAEASGIFEQPGGEEADGVVVGGEVLPWILSGKGGMALRAQAGQLHAHLAQGDKLDLAGVGRALVRRRATFEDRAVVLGSNREELFGGLQALAGGEPAANVLQGVADCVGPVAFVFPGQGSQWAGMAVELLESSPVFAESMRECEQALGPFVEWSLTSALRDVDGVLLERVDVVQPALFAVMVSLAELWRACGAHPDFVVGHSQGEIAAAYVAGGLSLQDAALVVASRSKALAALAGSGGMVSVACAEVELARLLESLDGGISIAAVNGPGAVVVSGELDALTLFLAQCESEGVRARRIPVDYAAHSVQVEAIEPELLEACASISPLSGEIPFYSAVTGGLIDTAELDAAYWYRNLRETVLFERATEALVERGCRAFVEVSPHPVLTVAVQETIERRLSTGGDMPVAGDGSGVRDGVVVVGSLRREEGGSRRFLNSLGELWVRGLKIDWEAIFGGGGFADVSLPTYAFQHERYWIEAGKSAGDPASIGLTSAKHPLLGAAAQVAGGGGWLFTGRLSLDSHPWLLDHVVMGTVLVPGTAFLELALHAADRVGCGMVAELVIEVPLVLEEDCAVQLQVTVSEADESGLRSLNVYSRLEPVDDGQGEEDGEWLRHAAGALASEDERSPVRAESVELAGEWPPQDAEPISLEGLYDGLAEIGLEYGPAFQGLQAAWRRGEEAFAEVSLPVDGEVDGHAFAIDPTMLDAALHALGSSVADESDGGLRLPFAWNGVRLHSTGASSLKVALTPNGDSSVSLSAVDESGVRVISVDSLRVRKVSMEQIQRQSATHSDSLHHVEWAPLVVEEEPADSANWVLLAPDLRAHGREGIEVSIDAQPVFADLTALGSAIEDEPAPRVVLAHCSAQKATIAPSSGREQQMRMGERLGPDSDSARPGDDELPLAVRESVQSTLQLLQEWLADERFADSLLVLVTHGAVAAAAGESVPGLIDAALWGLVRSAQMENPGRLGLIDLDDEQGSLGALQSAAASIAAAGEPQMAIRLGTVYVPRLVRETAGALSPPAGEECWRLAIGKAGTLEDLRLAASPGVADSLGQGQVRVAMRAAGVNFRDVVAALGVVALRSDDDAIGSEGAGVVLEVGPGVDDLAPGDRVMGLLTGSFGPRAVTDRRLLVSIPQGWSFAQAAAVPAAFLTAYYGLVDLAGVKAGERVLVHAAAGGVGMAAVQLARELGAEVFGTAAPAKWGMLRGLGLDEAHIASSRDAEFKQRFLATTEGTGVDVVLNSLTGELLDASLELMCDGGRFIEMGKADIRDTADVAERWPGVAYRAFDLIEAGPERIREMFGELLERFEQGTLDHSPIRTWDVRRAPEAFRFMAQARHAGKIVLTIPDSHIGIDSTILITGGTGGLGGLVARHLAEQHGARKLVLASRRGPEAPGAAELEEALAKLDVEVAIVACDVTDREGMRKLLESIPEDRPLRAVVHAAGVLDDGLIASLTPERLDAVLGAKVDAAWSLHELTREMDLDAFVLFSSIAGVMGGPGQGNYAAANAFLDALAARRRAQGLPAVSMAWGRWEQTTGLTGHLSEADLSRMRRSGIAPISAEEGLQLLDAAWDDVDALAVTARLDIAALRAQARADALPAMLRDLVHVSRRASAQDPSSRLAERLQGEPFEERRRIVLQLVRSEVAAVLGHSSSEAIDTQRALKELGFDSLLAVELRNRLNAVTALRLPATLVFDYPTSASVANYVLEQLSGTDVETPRPLAVRRSSEEPLAIVGMACRYPGGVRSPQEFWQLIASGGDAISEFPTDRGWELQRLYDPELTQPGTSYVREGGFLYDVAKFDAAFFGISPREALAMDPQQRLLLEASWEAVEDAGIRLDSLRGSQTGVFTGTTSQDYHLRSHGVSSAEEGYLVTGSSASVLSGRVAYTLGLEGPAISVDTACSSSLVALHLACGALRAGECSLALAGGVAVLSTPVSFTEFSRQRGLAPDGRCKSFADAADGTNWGEGVGVLLLERLSDAQRLGHDVLAVVRGSAVNQDGASNGLTAPNGPSQQRVIRQALANAGLAPDEVDAVEAHGTGTRLGDPIEAQALLATYGQGRHEDRPLWLGSIKSNIGHTQAAAGVAGVIKMVMALRWETLPKTLHVDEPSKQVDWSTGSVALLENPVRWQRNGRPRRAGVSSFGVSGTNVHLLLEEAPCEPTGTRETASEDASPDAAIQSLPGDRQAGGHEPVGHEPVEHEPVEHEPVESALLPWVVSGRGQPALREQAQRLHDLVGEATDLDVRNVGFSLASSRSAFSDRAVVVGADRHELLERVGALARGQRPVGVIGGSIGAQPRLAFLFTGQGAQRVGMGSGLYRTYPVFRQALDEVCECLEEPLGRSLRDVMFERQAGLHSSSENGLLDRTEFTQTALFALEVALFRLVQGWGISPDFLIGHSIGELVAAHVSGVLSLEGACRLVAARGRLMEELPAGGAMLSVRASEGQVAPLLSGLEDRVALAAVNGPDSTVISGDEDVVVELAHRWDAAGVKTKRLSVSHAFHSPRMDSLLDDFAEVARGLSYSDPAIPVVSNVTGCVSTTELCSPQYWVDHVRATVRFCDGVRWLRAQDVCSFLELGPDGTLAAMTRECLVTESETEKGQVTAVAMLRSERPEAETAISAAAELWVRGADVNWAGMFDANKARRVVLPTYAFQRQHYWSQSSARAVGDVASAGLAAVEHPLLSAAVSLASDRGHVLTGRLSLQTHPWLSDHMALGTVLLPATGFLELALYAGGWVDCEAIEELTLQAPLVLGDEAAVQLQVTVGELQENGRRSVEIHSRGDDTETDEDSWTCHATGVLVQRDGVEIPNGLSARLLENVEGEWPALTAEPVELESVYDLLAQRGMEYGPAFRGTKALWREGEHVLAEVALPENQSAEASLFGVHPALLDTALHGMGLCLPGDASGQEQVRLPFSWQGVALHARGAAALRVCLTASDAETVSMLVADETGRIVASVKSLTVRPVPAAQLHSSDLGGNDSLFGLEWRTVAHSSSRMLTPGSALIGPEDTSFARALSRAGMAGEESQAMHVDLLSLREALDAGEPVPEMVFVDLLPGEAQSGEEASEFSDRESQALGGTLHRLLRLLGTWLEDDRLLDSRLILVSGGAVAVDAQEEEATQLAGAAVWGMVRSAQLEHPGRLWLVDLDGESESWSALPAALELSEPQLALRKGVVHVPRMARLAVPSQLASSKWGKGVTLITGGTGALGGLLAKHLVAEHGVRDLVLASRRGPRAPGAPELQAELSLLGASVTVVPCDVSDAAQLEALIETVAMEQPLDAVVHTAGVLDDGLITSLTPQQLDRVLAAKVDAALHLDELTRRFDLSAFVLFSSLAGTLGSPGQAAYAAANACLDAIAVRRHAQGLPAVSLAWGWWDTGDGMAASLGEVDLARVKRSGMAPLSPPRGLELFDLACASGNAFVIPARLDRGVLRAQARAGTISPLLRALVHVPVREASSREDRSFQRRMAETPAPARARVATDMVRAKVAEVLGHASAEAIDADRALSELGFDSLAAVELRNRLTAMTGAPLPATLIFDYPTSSALAEYLLSQLTGEDRKDGESVPLELDRLERAVLSLRAGTDREAVAVRMQEILATLLRTQPATDGPDLAQSIESASDEEIFGFIDRELGQR